MRNRTIWIPNIPISGNAIVSAPSHLPRSAGPPGQEAAPAQTLQLPDESFVSQRPPGDLVTTQPRRGARLVLLSQMLCPRAGPPCSARFGRAP